MKRLNVLVSAYACNPWATEESYPGEAILGWNLIKQLSRYHDLSIITRTYNREGIETELQKENTSSLRFYYLTLPRFLSPLMCFITLRLTTIGCRVLSVLICLCRLYGDRWGVGRKYLPALIKRSTGKIESISFCDCRVSGFGATLFSGESVSGRRWPFSSAIKKQRRGYKVLVLRPIVSPSTEFQVWKSIRSRQTG
jgi:hypothetical protein